MRYICEVSSDFLTLERPNLQYLKKKLRHANKKMQNL